MQLVFSSTSFATFLKCQSTLNSALRRLSLDHDDKFNTFFIKSNRFVNLINSYNSTPASKLAINVNSKEYQLFVETLGSKIKERVSAIEKILGKKENLVFSTRAGEKQLVIKFMRSKTVIVINLDYKTSSNFYNDYLDRYQTTKTSRNYRNKDEFWRNIQTEIESIEVPKNRYLICNGLCKYFEVNKRLPVRAPRFFSQLSTQNKKKIIKLFQKNIEKHVNPWTIIEDSNHKIYNTAQYSRGGLKQFLRLKRIPKSRWKNYREALNGDIEINYKNEPFDSLPWGTLKTVTLTRIFNEFEMIKNSGRKSTADLFSDFIKLKGYHVTLDKQYLLPIKIYEDWYHSITSIYELFPEYRFNSSLDIQELKLKLTHLHLTDYIQKRQSLLDKLKVDAESVVQDDYFMIEETAIPLFSFSDLSKDAQDLITLEFDYINIINQVDIKSRNYKERKIGLASLFRATKKNELNLYHQKGYINIGLEKNFEPYPGLQVNKFKDVEGYSGVITEFYNLPNYLIIPSEANSILHQEVRLRYPTITKKLREYQ